LLQRPAIPVNVSARMYAHLKVRPFDGDRYPS
jgi:hypothetical protein